MFATLATLLIAGCALQRGPGPEAAATAAETARPPRAPATGWAELVEGAMPSVVLLLTDCQGEERCYGAGIVARQQGTVITNYHLVREASRIQVLPYAPDRISYSPLEGGVTRMVFQHEDDLLPAELLAADPLLDLAVLRVPQLEAPPLPMRDSPLRVGEPVLALGHPKQSVWSFTAGVVSALHLGLIQHDAPLNQGNSGGPLIDAHGRLVGVNTLELLGTEGMAYARPVALARPLLEGGQQALELDFSAPDAAWLSCEQAVDLAPWQALDCIWWDGEHQRLLEAAERVRAELALPDEVDQRLQQQIRLHSRSAWIGSWQLRIVRFLSGGIIAADRTPVRDLDYDGLWDSPEQRGEHAASIHARETLRERWRQLEADRQAFEAARAQRGGPLRSAPPGPTREARAHGQRLVELYLPTERMALMHVEAHSPEGELFGRTECWVLVPGGWRQRMSCPLAYQRRIPDSWPLPLDDHDLITEHFELQLSLAILGLTEEALR